jgi:hypothetical protein
LGRADDRAVHGRGGIERDEESQKADAAGGDSAAGLPAALGGEELPDGSAAGCKSFGAIFTLWGEQFRANWAVFRFICRSSALCWMLFQFGRVGRAAR